MKITRLPKIKKHRVFAEFSWPSDLPDFAQFNLIYGWNGAGKTTLSNLFRHVEIKQAVSEGEVIYHFDDQSCAGALLASAAVPQVRVFNRNFVDANVFSILGQMNPIFFLGQDSADKQMQVEELKTLRTKEAAKVASNDSALTRAGKALDEFCIREAKAVKELLSSSGANRYNNYDKASFKTACDRLSKLQPVPERLTESAKLKLKQQKDGVQKEAITSLLPLNVDYGSLEGEVERNLEKTVVSAILADLQNDPLLAEWVKNGLLHHTGERGNDTCRFCTSKIPVGRIAALEAHFNDGYKMFVAELDELLGKINGLKGQLRQLRMPDKSKFHGHLVEEYTTLMTGCDTYVAQATEFLEYLARRLSEKRSKPFEPLALGVPPIPTETLNVANTQSTTSVNSVIERHNEITLNFQKLVADARTQLENGLVVEAFDQFTQKTAAKEVAEAAGVKLKEAIRSIDERIAGLEKDILEHRRPAEELNAELRSYLGRDDLRFSLAGTGYQITRNGITAGNLSEGERGAIAFLYFLKSLHSKDFDLTHGVVVIDDPVSSLDANSLFCAFGYMKECTKNVGQLFILTHNFGFFRQVKNWFNHLPNQRKTDITKRSGRFYMLEARIAVGNRNASLKQLDPLLHQYESEYHYRFKKIYDEAKVSSEGQGLETFYSSPNIARRALEAFLAFRFPAEAGELKQQLDLSSFDAAKKARILRFLHTYSHDGKIAEPEHDLSILSETPAVLADLLEFIRFEDGKHFAEMEKLVTLAATAT